MAFLHGGFTMDKDEVIIALLKFMIEKSHLNPEERKEYEIILKMLYITNELPLRNGEWYRR